MGHRNSCLSRDCFGQRSCVAGAVHDTSLRPSVPSGQGPEVVGLRSSRLCRVGPTRSIWRAPRSSDILGCAGDCNHLFCEALHRKCRIRPRNLHRRLRNFWNAGRRGWASDRDARSRKDESSTAISRRVFLTNPEMLRRGPEKGKGFSASFSTLGLRVTC